ERAGEGSGRVSTGSVRARTDLPSGPGVFAPRAGGRPLDRRALRGPRRPPRRQPAPRPTRMPAATGPADGSARLQRRNWPRSCADTGPGEAGTRSGVMEEGNGPRRVRAGSIRRGDLEPYTALRWVGTLFKAAAVFLAVAVLAELIAGVAAVGFGVLPQLLGQVVRAVVLALVLW